MKSSPRLKKKSSRRKFFLPLLLIFLILTILGINKLGKMDLKFDFNWRADKVVSPQVSLSQETILQEMLGQYGLVGKEIKITGDKATAIVSGTKVFFNLGENLQKQVVSLQFILSRAKIEGKLPKSIDLRFSKPVVSY